MQAYVTLLSTASYLPGVRALAMSLRRTGTRRPLVAAVSANVPADADAALRGWGIHEVVRLPERSPLPHAVEQGDHYWSRSFDKLHLFGLSRFSKLVYLDSDMMVTANVDELFDKPHMAAVPAGRLVHPDWRQLNAGLMVIEPVAGLDRDIGQCLDAAARRTQAAGSQAMGDQDLLHEYYPDWPGRAELELDQGYNVFHEYVDQYLATGDYHLPSQTGDAPRGSASRPIKVVHYIGPAKPWMPKGVWRHVKRRLARRAGPGEVQTFNAYQRVLYAKGLPAKSLEAQL